MIAPLYQKWELDIIRELYPDIGEIRKLLPHRLVRSIRLKARQLGVAPRQAPAWTLPEISILTHLYPDIDAICRALPHRTRMAVLARIKLLGIGVKLKKWTPQRRAMLRKLYTVLGDKEAGEILGISAYAVNSERMRMGLLRQRRPANESNCVPVVADIRREASRQGAILRRVTAKAGCRPLKPSLTERRLSWGPIARVVEELGGELYADWDD